MGDSTGFDAFYAARAAGLIRHLFLSTGDMSRAEECVQEAFLRAWQRWDRLESDDPVHWVRTVSWRLAMNDWRRRARQGRALLRLGGESPLPPPSVEIMAVREALSGLPAGQRTVLVLHYFEDLSIREISQLIALPEGTVKARLARGRAAMSHRLSDSEEVDSAWTS